MNFLAQVQISCFFFSYLVSFGLEIYRMARQRTAVSRWLLLAFTSAGLLAHTAYLLTRSRQLGINPLMSSGQDWLLVLAWIGVVLYLILSAAHDRLGHGLFMLPAVLMLVAVAVFVRDDSTTTDFHQVTMRRWGMLHAASLVFGMASVLGVTISALMYLLNHQKLRARGGWLRRLQLPSLEKLTAVNRWMVILSVPFLTVGLVTGFILLAWSREASEKVEILWSDPTIVTTVVVWLAMVGLLTRLLISRRQSGKAVAQMSLLSGGFLLMTVLGPMLLEESGAIRTFHGRGDDEKVTPKQGSVNSPAAPLEGQP